MEGEVDSVRCLACGSEERDKFVDGAVQCADCGWPIYSDVSDYTAIGATPDGRVLPKTMHVWAPCRACGLTDDRLPTEDSATCQECGHVLLPWFVRDVTPQAVLEEFREQRAAQRHRGGDEHIQVGDRVVVSGGRLVGADPFTLLFVLAVHDQGDLDLVRDGDGTTWVGVAREDVMRL